LGKGATSPRCGGTNAGIDGPMTYSRGPRVYMNTISTIYREVDMEKRGELPAGVLSKFTEVLR
jgi:hypothetical protein